MDILTFKINNKCSWLKSKTKSNRRDKNKYAKKDI